MTALPSRQSGVALMIVLMAFALGSIFAAGMLTRQSLMIHGTGQYLTQSEAQSLALGAEAFARQILYRDWENNQDDGNVADHPGKQWAQYSVVLPVDAGVIEAQINDLNGRLNINDLVSEQGQVNQTMQERFTRLLEVLEIRSVTVEALIDWVDADDQRTGPGGAEDGEYLMQSPAYRAANRSVAHVSELRLLDGISREEYRRLRPHMTALPAGSNELNVNMATAPVIQSLHPDITEAHAESILATREEVPFETTEDFIGSNEFAGMGLSDEGLSVRTSYFEVASRVSVADSVYHLVSILHRSAEGEFRTLSRDAGQTGMITRERIELGGG